MKKLQSEGCGFFALLSPAPIFSHHLISLHNPGKWSSKTLQIVLIHGIPTLSGESVFQELKY